MSHQIAAYAAGDEGAEPCRLLWGRVPLALRRARTYTDFWEAYHLEGVPEGGAGAGRHAAYSMGSGPTNHVERFNNTLRQRLARFVRKTLSFSK